MKREQILDKNFLKEKIKTTKDGLNSLKNDFKYDQKELIKLKANLLKWEKKLEVLMLKKQSAKTALQRMGLTEDIKDAKDEIKLTKSEIRQIQENEEPSKNFIMRYERLLNSFQLVLKKVKLGQLKGAL